MHWETLQSTLSTQENAEFIAENLSYALGRLEAEEMGVLDGLSAILHRLQKLAEFSPQYAELVHRLDSSFLEIKDITNELQSETEKVEINPILIQELQKKVNLIQGLLVKHNTESVEQLIEIRNQMQSEQSGFENIEEEIAETQKDILIKEGLLNEKSLIISDKRKSAADVFKAKMEQLLQQLGLEKAKILAELTPSSDFHLLGKEHIKILFQANSGFEMKPIQQAISGGERSRVMLAVKKIMAENNQLPTLILDEIDTGVSGKVAEEIGMVMKDMAKDMQLIVISHLAQVAAKGTHHYKVQKFDVEGVTQSTIKPLSEEERLIEIAQLLSGSTITDAAVEQAKALMNKDA